MRFAWFVFAVLFFCVLPALAQSSTTTLAITAGGSPVSTVAGGTQVSLTATVTLAAGGTAAAPPGQVSFCEVVATPLRCTDIRLFSTAQLSGTGTAVFKFIPGPGTHSYRAVFLGTHLLGPSFSSAGALTVTPNLQSFTTLAASSVPGDYTLTATVTNTDGAIPITGSILFPDLSNSGYILATTPLVPVTGGGLTFVSAPPLPATISCSVALAVADFNGDGKQDIAAADCPDETADVSVLLGNGNATFKPTGSTPSFLTAYSPSIIVADFNQDGKADIAAAVNSATGYGGSGNPVQNAVQVLVGNGDGTFTTGPSTPVTSPQALATGDFNGDGVPDLAVTNTFFNGTSYTINTVSVLLGNGDGTFTLKSTLPTGVNPNSITVADFNLDGKADLAIANEDSNTVTVLLGSGDGTFTAAANPATGAFPISIVAADFNGDGIPDLAVVNNQTSSPIGPGSITILLGAGNGTFSPAGAPLVTGLSPLSIAVGDFNGDGKADLVTANAGLMAPAYNTASFFIGNGDGTFAAAISAPLALGSSPEMVATADFDGSGDSDMVASALGSITVILPQTGSVAVATVGGISPDGNGPHEVDAQYPGDSNNSASVSAPVYLTAKPITTSLSLSANPINISYGQQVLLTIAINPFPAQNLVPTGSISIAYQGIGNAVTVTGAVNIFNLVALPVGTYTITAAYTGDANFLPSKGSISVTVNPASTTSTLVSSLNPANALQTVTFTSTVSGVSFSGLPPAGSVSFTDGSTVLGSVPLVAGSAASTAAFSTSKLTVGPHTINATYVPTTGYGASTATLTETINPTPQDFTITLASPSVTLKTFQTSTTAVTLVSLGAFADTLALTCGTMPAYATCTLTPSSIPLVGNATVTASLHLATDTIPSRNALNRPPYAPGLPLLALLLAPAGFFAARRRRRVSILNVVLLAAFSVAALTLAGCGSLVYPLPSATPGTYTIPITATGASTGRTHTAQLILTITP